MRVRPRQRGRRLDRGADEDPLGEGRPGPGGPARDQQRADLAAVRRERARRACGGARTRSGRAGRSAPRRTPPPRRFAARRRARAPGPARRPGCAVRCDGPRAARVRRPTPRSVGVVPAASRPSPAGPWLRRGVRPVPGLRRPRSRRATGSRPAALSSVGSSRSLIGNRVDEVEPPVRALTRVASRTRASGRRRTITTWSAPVPAPSSSTIAPTIASGEIERDRPCRIRAKLSASNRRLASSSWTARRWRTAANPTITIRAVIATSSGRTPPPSRRMTEITPSAKKVPAKTSQERRIPGSSAAADGRRSVGVVTFGGEHDGPGRTFARRRGWYFRQPGPGTSVRT